jgi:hypothetical protein
VSALVLAYRLFVLLFIGGFLSTAIAPSTTAPVVCGFAGFLGWLVCAVARIAADDSQQIPGRGLSRPG